MSLPNIDLDELKKLKEANFKSRLDFIEKHIEWLKKTNNKKWSSEKKELVGD